MTPTGTPDLSALSWLASAQKHAITPVPPFQNGEYGPVKFAIWDAGWEGVQDMRLLGETAYKVLGEGLSTLKDLGHNPYIAAGTCLGAVRDGHLIPHDGDLDVEVLVSREDAIKVDPIFKRLISKGFYPLRVSIDGPFVCQMAFVKDGAVFDIYLVYRNDDLGVGEAISEYGKVHTPLKFITDTDEIEMEGAKYPCPLTPEEYCLDRYGSTWKTPHTSKQPWQDDTANLVTE